MTDTAAHDRPVPPMHHWGPDLEAVARRITTYVLERAREEPPLDGPRSPEELQTLTGATITAEGLGFDAAMGLWEDVLSRACVSQDHPRALAFVPSAASEVSMLFDALVGASSIYGGSWMEGAGAIHAENQALAWLASLAGFPEDSGGCFVSGGTAGNLSALVAARHAAAQRREGPRPTRWRVAASAEAHSSIAAAARVMDAEILGVPVDERGRVTGEALAHALATHPDGGDGVFAVVATAGTTNAGQLDDLAGVAAVAARHDLWFHVDAAYGGAGLASPRLRPRYAGIEAADSFVVDPHKWLFAPFDACGLIYRRPEAARAAFTQHAAYLDVLHDEAEWNPSDLAHHLSRRARGLPFWFSLACHGTDAYALSVDLTLDTARAATRLVEDAPHLELVLAPELTVVMFRRIGWAPEDYQAWSEEALARGLALCVPTTWHGETVLRLCIVNPRTTPDDIALVLASLT